MPVVENTTTSLLAGAEVTVTIPGVATAVIVVEAAVCEVPTVYVPIPPEPVTNAVIVVPAVTPVPEITCPTAISPEETAVTVSVVVAIEPVNEAPPVIVAACVVPAVVARLYVVEVLLFT